MRLVCLVTGIVALAVVWLGPLPALSSSALSSNELSSNPLSSNVFAAHMTMHMVVVAVAAPLLAFGVAGSRLDPVERVPSLFAPIPASIVELLVVWGWHAPLLHHAARTHLSAFVLEQGTFLMAGLLLWLAVAGGRRTSRPWRAAAGAGALLFTSIHMTLLGALFALSPRALYAHGHSAAESVADQHLGGAVMLVVGGASYLLGSLWLLLTLLRTKDGAVRPHRAAGMETRA